MRQFGRFDDAATKRRLGGPNVFLATIVIASMYAFIAGILSFHLSAISLGCCMMAVIFVAMLASEYVERGHPFAPGLVLVGLLVASVAAILGILNYHHNYAPYITAKAGREYEGVAASGPASAFADGGVLYFKSDVVLDSMRSFGFRSRGLTYCVAPVLGPEQNDVSPVVQFWAVGLNCCAPRGGFTCDDASEDGIHSGVVLHDQLDTVTSEMFAPRTNYDEYRRAIMSAAAFHDIGVAQTPVLLSWVGDPSAGLEARLRAAVATYLTSVFVCAVLVLVMLFPMHRMYALLIQRATTSYPQDGPLTAFATGQNIGDGYGTAASEPKDGA